jgi:hypothetical protein
MKIFIVIVAMLSVLGSTNVLSQGTMINNSLVAGSIRDILPNLTYIEWEIRVTSHEGGLYDDLQSNVLVSLNKMLEEDVKQRCSKHAKNHKKVFYGIDNVTFSKRHIRVGDIDDTIRYEVTAAFNWYCAY